MKRRKTVWKIGAAAAAIFLLCGGEGGREEALAAASSGNKTVLSSDREEDQTETGKEIEFSETLPYGEFSAIHSGKAVLYENRRENAKGITVCVNAGHGCAGGEKQKTYCHPDKTPKVTSGTTAAGAVKSSAISSGMTFADGTPEAEVTLKMAMILKERLLEEGYSVLMVREAEDSQLDNVARTVLANNYADCHIALHWDSTSKDKGAFFMSVPSNATYRAMEPVASHWKEHNALGRALIEGLKGQGCRIFGTGEMEMDLTQTSYSTVPSVDVELGDKKSDYGKKTLEKLADGLTDGIGKYFEENGKK